MSTTPAAPGTPDGPDGPDGTDTAPTGDLTAPPWRAWAPGTRVMIRRRIDDPDHPYTDVLGEVLTNDATGLTLRTRRGDVHVPAHAIAIGKPVPPAPARRRPRTGELPAG